MIETQEAPDPCGYWSTYDRGDYNFSPLERSILAEAYEARQTQEAFQKECQEALDAMAKAEAAWDKMIDETVQSSGEFIKDCEEAIAAMKA